MNDSSDNHNHPEERQLGRGMLYVAWVIALLILTAIANQWLNGRQNPNTMPTASSADGVNQVILKRNHQHHYVTTGLINDVAVDLLVDTGATHVSVPKHLASKLNLKEGAPGLVTTANGTVEVSSTVIQNLSIGSIHFYEVRASINPGMEEDQILLGMSALKNIEFIHRDGTLTLNQYY